jgi:alpha-L-fucosidase
MKNKITTFILILLAMPGFYTRAMAQAPDKMQWFKDAKLGIFIHWGIYAVDGIDESWSF